MSYRHETTQLAKCVAQLMASGVPLHPRDLPAAVAGREALLRLLNEVHVDIAGPSPDRAEVAEVERRPIGALGRLLHDHPRLQPPSSDTAAVAVTGAIWQRVQVHATRALESWRLAHPASKPVSGAAGWAEMADIAALSSAVAALDDRLAETCRQAGLNREADTLWYAARSGLRTTAEHVQQVAAAGPLPAVSVDPHPAVQPLGVPVQNESHLEAAAQNTVALLDGARDLTPDDLRYVAYVHGKAAMRAAEVLAPSAPARADQLRTHAQQLMEVAGTMTTDLVSGVQGEKLDRRAVHQAGQLDQFVSRWSPPHGRDADGYYARFAQQVPAVTQAISRAAERQYQEGRWYCPDPHSKDPSWTRTGRPGLPEPRFISALRAAGQHAQTMRSPSGLGLAHVPPLPVRQIIPTRAQPPVARAPSPRAAQVGKHTR